MKQKGQRKLPFFYHWKLSRKLLLLFFGIGILPITVIFGITLYRMVQKSSQMQLYTMDKNFDRMEQTMDNIQDRIGRIGSLVTVSDQVGDALRSDKPASTRNRRAVRPECACRRDGCCRTRHNRWCR